MQDGVFYYDSFIKTHVGGAPNGGVSTCTNVLSTQPSEMRHSLHVVSLLGVETG